ncbi:MAG TPA: hypothetical protein PLY89_08230, partial [Synergistaceae bacterium]|nr:hypothetical protein [Synergistaceae bacterium]
GTRGVLRVFSSCYLRIKVPRERPKELRRPIIGIFVPAGTEEKRPLSGLGKGAFMDKAAPVAEDPKEG